MTTTTDRTVAVQRPRFSIEGEERPQLASDLLWMEVRHDEAGVASLEARFNNLGASSDGQGSGYRWFDGDVLQLGKGIKVAAGEEDNEALVFSGAISAVAGRFGADRPPELVVRAEDAGLLLRMGQRTRVYEESSDADAAGRVAGDHGLQVRGQPEGPTHTQIWQVNETDLAFLRHRARAVDARLGIADTTLAFEPRRGEDEAEPIALTTLRELLSFEAEADLAHQRTEVQVHGWSVADKAGIHETAGGDAVTAESGGGRTGPQVLDELGWSAVEHHHLEVPATTEEARTLATAMMRRRARRFLTARGTTSGTPAMRVGSRVDVADAGPYFSGRWVVVSVRHTFDQARGFRTHFLAERTDLGGRG